MKRSAKFSIDVVRGERVYSFLMDQGAACGEAYDACHEVLQEILKIASEIVQRSAIQKAAQSPVEESHE